MKSRVGLIEQFLLQIHSGVKNEMKSERLIHGDSDKSLQLVSSVVYGAFTSYA